MKRFLILSAVLAAICHARPAFADAQLLGTFQSWSAYISHGAKGETGQDVCYISSKPLSPDNKPHAGVFAEVTHRPAEHHLGVIDLLESYTFKPGAPATLTVGSANFAMFTHGVAAFAKDEDDSRIVAAMRSGATSMQFAGTDKKGKANKDTFSLAGMEQAYRAIGKACHVPTSAAPKAAKPAKK